MTKHRRITALVLALLLCVGAMLCTSAAQKDIAEISAKTGLEPVSSFSVNADLTAVNDNLPSYYSSYDLGLTLDVRQQHDNTCWAFGALSSFETTLLKNGESNVQILAPQHANYWSVMREDGTGWQRDIHSSGYSYIPLGYLTSWAGPLNEADFPEETSTQEDYDNLTLTPQYGLTEAVYFNNDTDRDAIKDLIYTYGSVVASFNSDLDYLTDNTSFYCGDSSLTTAQLQGHCVSVVGWDDNYAKENFADSLSGMPENDGAWLMKNSWGTWMSELRGYFWISYEDVWLFDEIFGPSYALTNYEALCEDVKLYQNEIDGATYEFNYFADYNDENQTITYMNAFDFTEEDRNLDKVVFESTSLGSEYTVYYIPFDGDLPTEETLLWTQLSSGVISHTGYICVDIEDIELPEGKGAIGIKIANDKSYNTLGVCEWLTVGNNKYIFKPQSDYGMSYYMDMDNKENGVEDLMKFYERDLRDDIGGTFVIKAITRNECAQPHPTEPEETTTPTETATADTEPTTFTTDPTEPSTAPVTSVPATTVPSTTVPVTTTTPVTDSTEPTSTDSTEPTTATTAPATTVTLPTGTTTVLDITEPFIYKLGDADLSDTVNVKDATLIQKHAASLVTLSERGQLAADVNGNGYINVVDATNIQKYVAGMKTNYKVGQTHIYYE